MDYYAIWPYFAAMAMILLIASTPLLRLADTPPTMVLGRLQSIDGLRGFLALGVFFHHSAIYHRYLLTGDWTLPPIRFYANLGPAGVAVFFMITSYLFWTQILKARGRPDWLRLYVGRVFRIVPLYLLLAFTVILSVGVRTGWRPAVPPLQVTQDVLKWLAGGVFLGFDINGFAKTFVISAGVTWSLRYEWMFYFSLFIMSLSARRPVIGAIVPVLGLLLLISALLLYASHHQMLASVMSFFVGMTVAAAKLVIKPRRFPEWMLSTVVVGCLALVLLSFDRVYDVTPIILLGVAFGLVVSGASIFGILLTRPAKRLGDISYGIYLFQGPILFLAFASPFVRAFATGSPWGHWLIVTMAAGALVMLATATHGLIERPGIETGRRVFERIASMRRYSLKVEVDG